MSFIKFKNTGQLSIISNIPFDISNEDLENKVNEIFPHARFEKSAIKSSIKQYICEEKTNQIADLLQQLPDGFKGRDPKEIETEVDSFIEKFVMQYRNSLSSDEIKYVLRNQSKLTDILVRNKVIYLDSDSSTVIPTHDQRPVQAVAKYLIEKIDAELLLEKHYVDYLNLRFSNPKAFFEKLKTDSKFIYKDQKVLDLLDKAFASHFRDKFYQIFAPTNISISDAKMIFKVIDQKIKDESKSYDNRMAWLEQTGGITKEMIQACVTETEEGNIIQQFADAFNPQFVAEIQTLCKIKKRGPEIFNVLGMRDFKLFDLIGKYSKHNLVSLNNGQQTDREAEKTALTQQMRTPEMPADLLKLICDYLNIPNIISFGSVNKRHWHCILSTNPISLFATLLRTPPFFGARKNPASIAQLAGLKHNIETGKCFMRFFKEAHKGQVQCSAICNNATVKIDDKTVHEGDVYISGSSNHTIQVWNLQNEQSLKLLEGHTGAVTCIAAHNNRIISGSTDQTIKIWNLATGEEPKTLKGHQSPIQCITAYNDTVISSSQDTIKIWNLETGEEKKSYKISSAINCIAVHKGKLICGATNGITIIDLETHEEQKISANKPNEITINHVDCIAVFNDMIFTGQGNEISIWDLNTGKELRSLQGHKGVITSVTISNDKIISTSNDFTTKIWDLNTGKELQSYYTSNYAKKATVYDGKIILDSDIFRVLDFNSRPFRYSKEILDKNIRAIDKIVTMTTSFMIAFPKKILAVAEELHPDFRQNLPHLPIGYMSLLQTKIYIEALFVALYNEEDNKVFELVNKLVKINRNNTLIYSELCTVLGKPPTNKYLKKAEQAFLAPNKPNDDFPVSRSQKMQALASFARNYV